MSTQSHTFSSETPAPSAQGSQLVQAAHVVGAGRGAIQNMPHTHHSTKRTVNFMVSKTTETAAHAAGTWRAFPKGRHPNKNGVGANLTSSEASAIKQRGTSK
jgi:hypothetical protein